MTLASFAGKWHGAAGVQGRTVGAAGGGGCDGVLDCRGLRSGGVVQDL